MIEILFLLGFSLLNLEEALWLPEWSKHAKKFHKEVRKNEFRFAVIIITAIGCLLTFQYFILKDYFIIAKYIYLGFVLMMIVNVVFPHLISTILLKRYAPGTITGIILNAPIGVYLTIKGINNYKELIFIIISGVVLSSVLIPLIHLLFTIGKKLFD